MKCSCIPLDFDDWVEIIEKKVGTSDEESMCDECCSRINPGENREYIRADHDGRVFENVTCHDCLSIRDVFFCDFSYRRIHSDLREHIDNLDGEVSAECLLSLTPRARDIVFSYIEDVWKEIVENLDDEEE